jgi:hypothetical protein
MPGVSKKYLSALARCGIGDEEFIELMEAAWWALSSARQAVGTHLDLNDDYLDGLEAKVHKYMNDEMDTEGRDE